jgi:hypothetical protein
MMRLGFILVFLTAFVSGCASSSQTLQSDFQKLNMTKSGVVMTVNLQTNGHVREDKSCYLKINDGSNDYELLIQRGIADYALPLQSKGNTVEITKITCGPFYYYDLKNQGATFKVKDQKIKYLGFINFRLEDKGQLEWGHATKDELVIRKRAQSMGFDYESLEVDLLKL